MAQRLPPLRILLSQEFERHLGAGLYHNPPVERIAVEADLSYPQAGTLGADDGTDDGKYPSG